MTPASVDRKRGRIPSAGDDREDDRSRSGAVVDRDTGPNRPRRRSPWHAYPRPGFPAPPPVSPINKRKREEDPVPVVGGVDGGEKGDASRGGALSVYVHNVENPSPPPAVGGQPGGGDLCQSTHTPRRRAHGHPAFPQPLALSPAVVPTPSPLSTVGARLSTGPSAGCAGKSPVFGQPWAAVVARRDKRSAVPSGHGRPRSNARPASACDRIGNLLASVIPIPPRGNPTEAVPLRPDRLGR